MAINLGDNIKIQGNLPIDYRYFNNLVPYTSTGQVDSIIPVGERFLGLTVNINNVEYWYANSVADGNLVLKINAGTLNAAANGLSLSGTTVILGGSNLTIPTIIGDSRIVPVGIQYGGNYNASFVDTSLITKSYADAVATGVHPKLAVQVATTGNTALSGLLTIDGITLLAGERVLVKNQAVDSQNGIYIATGGTWQRSSDFDFTPSGETLQGTLIPVITGKTNGNTLWVLVSPDPVLSGNSITFTLFGTVTLTAGVGINILGSTVSVDGSALAGNYIDWSGTQFDVNANSIVSGYTTLTQFGNYTGSTQPILNAALTGACNGLSYSNRCVCLGGTLSQDTIVSGDAGAYDLSLTGLKSFNLGFDSVSTITDGDSNGGIRYAACYHPNYVDRSLVDKEYVDKKISGSTSGSSLYLLASPSTVEVGGMPALTPIYGCRIDKMLEKILVKYLAPSFSSFSASIPSPIEVGSTISGLEQFNWSFTNAGNVSGGTMCIYETNPVYLVTGNTSISSPKQAYISTKTFTTCGEIQRWCGSVKNTQGAQFNSGYHTVTALLPYYWGVRTVPGPAGAGRPAASSINITGGSEHLVSSSSPFSVPYHTVATADDYLWFAVPSTVTKTSWYVSSFSFGSIGGAVGVGSSFCLFPNPTLMTVTKPIWGAPQSYNVYVSNWQTKPDATMLLS
jgi:hypothetical protein